MSHIGMADMEPAEKLKCDLCGAMAELDASGEEVTNPRYKSVCPEIHTHPRGGSAESIDCAHFGPIVRREIYRLQQCGKSGSKAG